MRAYINRTNGDVATTPYERSHVTQPFYAKRADLALLEVQFNRDNVAELPTDPLLTFILKNLEDYGGTALVNTTSFTAPGDATGFYELRPDFDEDALNDLLVEGTIGESVANQAARYALTGKALGYLVKQIDSDPATYWEVIDIAHLADAAGWGTAAQKDFVDLGGEIVLQESPDFGEESSKSFTVRLFNDYKKGGEANPTPGIPYSRAFALNRYAITGLTGGGATKLDGIVTAGLDMVGSVVLINMTDGSPILWRLVAGTDAENAPGGIVRPDDYDGATNAFVWKSIL